MNETYIKRQLTLHKLGFPMDKYIQEFFDLFNKLIGDPNELTKVYGKYSNMIGHIYSKNNTQLLFHCDDNETFFINYYKILLKFERKFGIGYIEMCNILCCILDSTFNYKVSRIWKMKCLPPLDINIK